MSRETYSRKVYADCHFCNSDSECFARKGGKCQILDGQGKRCITFEKHPDYCSFKKKHVNDIAGKN